MSIKHNKERSNVAGVKTNFSNRFSELKFPIVFSIKSKNIAHRAPLIIIGCIPEFMNPVFIATISIITEFMITETVSNKYI